MSSPSDTPPPPTAAEARPGPARRLWRFVTSPRMLLQATGVLALALIATGSALLLPPAHPAGDLPGDEALGTLATRSYKANRDFILPDPGATEAARTAAAAAVRPVYDFDLGLARRLGDRIADSFAHARAHVEAGREERAAARKTRRGRGRAAPVDEAAERLELAAEAYGEFVKRLQVVVEEPVYRGLAREGFSEALEQASQAVLRAALAEEVAPGRELLIAERDAGITVRKLGAGVEGRERDVRDVERIVDVAQVRLELARLASGLHEATGTRLALALPAGLPAGVRAAAAAFVARLVAPNLTYGAAETARRRQAAAVAVKPIVLQYAQGEKIIGDGERIEARHLLVFRFLREQARTLDVVQVRLGAALLAALLVTTVFALARRTIRRFRPGKRDLVFLAAALIGNLALLRSALAGLELLRDRLPWLTTDLVALAVPLAAGTMLVRMLRSGESSIVFALAFTPLAGLLLSSQAPAVAGLVGALAAAERLGRRTGRRALPLAALEAGLLQATVVTALGLLAGRPLGLEVAQQAGAAFAGTALLAPIAAALTSPLFEALFGYTSEGALARLANLNHPVLKELIIKAPGTYHHSLLVGTLAESAARRIDAHPLLARIGGYYHDLGKAKAALLFGENQKAENRLEKLTPDAAAEALRAHVADGLERAHAARLPRAVIDVIAQHHGTRLAGSFYQRAREAAERDGRPAPPEAAFRYPGPRPRSRESALIMLADAIEAASRALTDPTPERLQALAPRVVDAIVLEGQLDECDLTLAELRLAVEAFQETIVEVVGLSRVEALPTTPRPPGATLTPEPPLRAVR